MAKRKKKAVSEKKAPAESAAVEVEESSQPTRATAVDLAKKQREISVAEFFTKNRHLLGFDNPRKALLTTIKEGVDNSLDACEEAGILPDIKVQIMNGEADDRYRVVIEDNGPGVVRSQIPRIFAKLLYGSKFHTLRMARGQQGIGISAAGMYGQLTTGRPVCITSKTSEHQPAHYYELLLDTKKNEPKILKDEKVDWNGKHGTKVQINLEAKYQKGRQSVDDYLEQTAIANPHVHITYVTPDGKAHEFPRATKQLPELAKEIRPHPYGIELGMLLSMLEGTKARRLKSFLQSDFSRVSARVAKEICEVAGVPEKASPKRIARSQADALFKAIQQVKLRNPPTDCIAPIGEELILAGLRKEIDAEFYTSTTRPPSVYRGNPFQIEVGLAYGGESSDAERSIKLLRYANRVPLQYQQSACAIARAVINTSWKRYGLQQSNGALPVGPMVMMVHMASVWVPFTSESKEAVAHYPEIIKEIGLALQECGRRLGVYKSRARKTADAAQKKAYIRTYIPYIGEALQGILDLSDRQRSRIDTVLSDLLERSRS